jgi:hypothetical protein
MLPSFVKKILQGATELTEINGEFFSEILELRLNSDSSVAPCEKLLKIQFTKFVVAYH